MSTEPMEFGQEIYFRTDRSVVKPNQPNRYWLELPQNWSIQHKQDPVIGISEVYFNQCIRYVHYTFKFELIDQTMGINEPIPAYTISFTDHQYMSRGSTFRDFVNGFVSEWNEAINAKNIELASYKDNEEVPRPLTPFKNYDAFVDFGYEMRGSEKVCVLKWSAIEDPSRWDGVIDPASGNDVSVIPRMTIEMLNDDAIEVLNGSKNEIDFLEIDNVEELGLDFIVGTVTRENVLRLYPRWDRHNVFITSSISSMTAGEFLGYSRAEPLHRLKFYRLDNNTQKIWIELYSARENDVKIVLPKDGRDYLAIEGVVYFNASKALK